MRWPYLTFIMLAVFTLSYIYGLNKYEIYLNQRQTQYVDPITGSWKKSHDWQAENRRTALLDRLRYFFTVTLFTHSIFNCFYSLFFTPKNKRYAFTPIFFIAITLLLAILWVAMFFPIGGMIG